MMSQEEIEKAVHELQNYVVLEEHGQFVHHKVDRILYEGTDNYKRPKTDYLKKLILMDDKALFEEAKHMIWLSAYAANNNRSDYHFQCHACYSEGQRRHKPEIYVKAHNLI